MISHLFWDSGIEYRSDDIAKRNFFLHFSILDVTMYKNVSVEHDVKHPQAKFDGNGLMVARDMAA